MWAAPIGAFGGMAYTVSVFGADSLTSLGALMVVFWGTCAFFVFVVLGLVARASGFSIFRMVRLIRDELLIIVGTSSSETVLPRLLAKLQAAGASKQVTGMVIPTGYSFNLDGTCIYLTLGALFIVQATGQDMAIGEQIAMAGLMILTSKGAAGITGAGLVTLTASLQAFGGTFFSRRDDRRRHRARGRDRPDHERGPRADQRDRQLGGDDGDRASGRASATTSASSRSCATRRSSTARSSGRCSAPTTRTRSAPGRFERGETTLEVPTR